jgi:hypothetical protein
MNATISATIKTLLRAAAVLLAAMIALGSVSSAGAAPAPTITTTKVSLSSSTSHPYQAFTVTATVHAAGVAVPIGTVTFTRNGQTLCSDRSLNSSGVASCQAVVKNVSTGPVTAAYSPTRTTFAASTARSGTEVVSKWTPTITAKLIYRVTGCTTHPTLSLTILSPADASAARTAGLPSPHGQITSPSANGSTAVPSNGTVTRCLSSGVVGPTSSAYTYSGDAYYARVSSVVNGKGLDTAPRAGSGGGVTPVGTSPASGGLATTGPKAPITLLLWLAGALLAVGTVCTIAGRGSKSPITR